MRNNTRLLALLLALTMLCSAFTACGTTQGGETSQTTTSSAPATETTAPVEEAPAELNLVVDGKMQYSIIRSDDVDASAPEVVHARNIIDTIKTLTGSSSTLGTDWTKKGTALNSEKLEILVGNTDYPETQQVAATLNYGDWAVRAVGNKIVIFGYDTASLGAAVSSFTRLLRKSVSEDGKNITLATDALEQTDTQNHQLAALPHFEGGTFYSYYEAGNDCDEIIIRDTTVEQYNAYLTALEAAGFVKYTDNEIADNLFATYNSEKYTVNVGYYDYETAVRVLIEPLAPAVGLKEDNVYTVVTTPQLTMLGQEYTQSDGTLKSNGQSILIRLSDGRFIIVDGGHNRADVATELLQTMREQSAAYAKTDKDITVAAWIVTHAHGDHFGTLVSKYSTFTGITVERILVNFLSETERVKAINSSTVGKNWDATEGNAYTKVPTAAAALGAEIHNIHVGQVYYLADVTMEVIYTIESFAPEVCNALNTSSTVMKMNIAGTTYMSTGDATGNGMELCADMYGEYIQSDIVQVCHHGGTTWGNNSGMIKAYRIINAPTVLWPRGITTYEASRSNEYNSVLYSNSNYKEDYVSGKIGDLIVLPMPYTIGSATVTRADGSTQ